MSMAAPRSASLHAICSARTLARPPQIAQAAPRSAGGSGLRQVGDDVELALRGTHAQLDARDHRHPEPPARRDCLGEPADRVVVGDRKRGHATRGRPRDDVGGRQAPVGGPGVRMQVDGTSTPCSRVRADGTDPLRRSVGCSATLGADVFRTPSRQHPPGLLVGVGPVDEPRRTTARPARPVTGSCGSRAPRRAAKARRSRWSPGSRRRRRRAGARAQAAVRIRRGAQGRRRRDPGRSPRQDPRAPHGALPHQAGGRLGRPRPRRRARTGRPNAREDCRLLVRPTTTPGRDRRRSRPGTRAPTSVRRQRRSATWPALARSSCSARRSSATPRANISSSPGSRMSGSRPATESLCGARAPCRR